MLIYKQYVIVTTNNKKLWLLNNNKRKGTNGSLNAKISLYFMTKFSGNTFSYSSE